MRIIEIHRTQTR